MPVDRFELSAPVRAKPLNEWKSVAVELLGCQTRMVQGARWRHRIIEHGQGEALLLYHGVGGHADCYARNMKNLGKHFRTIAVDALYHGYSDEGPWDINKRHDYQVDAIVDLMDALGLQRAHIEGESMGAQLVFEFGMRYPERSGKLIMNTGLGWRVKLNDEAESPEEHDDLADRSMKVVTAPTYELMKSRMAWLVADKSRMTDEMVEMRLALYQDPVVNAKMRRWFKVDNPEGDAWDLNPMWVEEDLKTFQPESLVFWTEHNPGEPPADGERWASLLPGAKFYSMDDAAHWPQWEKPEEHDQVLIEFIKGPGTTT